MSLFVTVLLCAFYICNTHAIQDDDYFDFIVVGSGDAGSIVASRLATAPHRNYRVLVLEAGELSQRVLGGTDYVMSAFVTDPETGQLTLGTPYTRFDVPLLYRTITHPAVGAEWGIPNSAAAKAVGGSMVHNGMVWLWPTEADLDRWGVPGWSWAEYFPFLRKAENVTGSRVQGDTLHHSLDGPIQISDPALIFEPDYVFLNTCIASGLPYNNDINGASRDGCGIGFNNIRRGVRESTAAAYLAPALKTRRNLSLRIYSQVTKVIFDRSRNPPLAIGVEYVNLKENGFPRRVHRVYASKEVILCGGTLNTPKTLMHSGIGPAAELQQYGIPVLVDNPNVGQHIRNHIGFPMTWSWPNPVRPNIYNLVNQTLEYAISGKGFYATNGLSTVSMFFRTADNLTEPDAGLSVDYGTTTLTDKFFRLSAVATIPKLADGVVSIVSPDPLVNPNFVPNTLSHEEDIDTIVFGIRKARQLMALEPAHSYFQATELFPGPAVQTDEDLRSVVRQVALPIFHYYGSAKMGIHTDPTVVVDNRLRVIGVAGLRIVDASIIPGSVHIGLQAAVVGVGEKGVQLILDDHDI